MSVIVIIRRFKKYIRVKKTFNERIAGVKTAIYKRIHKFSQQCIKRNYVVLNLKILSTSITWKIMQYSKCIITGYFNPVI